MALGVTDFIAKRGADMSSESASACYSSIKVGSSIEEVMKRIRSTISDNVTCLVICVLVLLVTGAVVWYVASTLVGALAEWRRHRKPGPSAPTLEAPGSDDDVARRTMGEDDELPSGVDESAAVAERMAKIKVKYDHYNKAIARHAAKSGLEPDDVIDSRIMSRADDDFRYGRGEEKLRFRKTRQEWVESEGEGKRGTTPKYQ